MTQSTSAPSGTSSGPDVLTGTPVVPGVAYGPVLLARTDVSAAAVAVFEATSPSNEEAMASYDAAVATVSGRLADRAGKAHGSAAEVLTATAGLARDKRRAGRNLRRSLGRWPPALGRSLCRAR